MSSRRFEWAALSWDRLWAGCTWLYQGAPALLHRYRGSTLAFALLYSYVQPLGMDFPSHYYTIGDFRGGTV